MKRLSCNLMVSVLVVCTPVHAVDSERLLARAERYFDPLPEIMQGAENDSAERIELGKQLFFDKRLSINDSQACVTCHRLEQGYAGVDNLAVSPGAKGKAGSRNSPTVLNAGLQASLFWDGRADNLVEQAKGPILNDIEMAMPDEKSVENKLRDIKEYRDKFAQIYPAEAQPITFQNVVEMIAAFERTLLTKSRFDDFLQGDLSALSEIEKRGLETFIKIDCVYCHDGVLLGGQALEQLGAENAYDNQADQGVYELTKDEADKMVFKVSPLRNVSLTSPYFHDGKIEKLDQAVKLMGKLQLDEDLTEQQVVEITAFLNSLTDKTRE